MPHLSEVVVALFTISLFILDHLVASMTKQRRTTTMHDRIMPEINFYNHKINFRSLELNSGFIERKIQWKIAINWIKSKKYEKLEHLGEPA